MSLPIVFINLDRDAERRTRLLAPRDGIVTKRVARQFEEIPAGQPVYEVGSRDALEVLVLPAQAAPE